MSLSKVVGRVFTVADGQGWYDPENRFTYDQYHQDVVYLSERAIEVASGSDPDPETGERYGSIESGPLLVRGRIFDDGNGIQQVAEVFVIAGEYRNGQWVNGNEPWPELY